MQHQEALHLGAGHLRLLGQAGVDALDLALHEVVDLRARRQVGVAGVDQAAALGPGAHRFQVDVDEGADVGPLLPEGDGLLDVGAELQLVFQVARREQRVLPVGEVADVAGAVDDLQVPLVVQVASVARMHPAVRLQRLGGGVGVLVIAQEHAGTAVQDLAVGGDLELHLGHDRADGIGLHVAVRLHADEDAGLRHAVELLDVDAERAVEGENLRADGLAGGVGQADAAEAQVVLERPVDQRVAEAVQEGVEGVDGLVGELAGADALRHLQEELARLALDPGGVLEADHHRRQDIFPHARRREEVGRANIVKVRQHRVAALRAIEGEAAAVELAVREDVVAHPRHRQVRQDFLGLSQPLAFQGVAGGDDDVVV